MFFARLLPIAVMVLSLAILPVQPSTADPAPRPDLMTFAQGVLPVSIETGDARLGVGMSEAISVIDGNLGLFSATPKPGLPGDVVEITFSMPAPTRFDRFAVPNVSETPSPSQTFFKHVEVLGASASPDGPYIPLASAELSTHGEPGLVTDLTLTADQPEVLWVRLRLWDGINTETDKTFYEFSELIGNGSQQTAANSDGFDGVWKGRGVKIELAQEGASVTGCYDGNSQLSGSVDGKILRALGTDPAGVPSQFILIAAENGDLRGLRSTNGAPFKPYDGETSAAAPVCLPQEPPSLGCGAIIHGIGFDYDSDVIRPSSKPLLTALFAGLSQDGAGQIHIVGHSSSEGAADYNRDLSRRRAQAVVAALVAMGMDPSAISASGRGEDEPIASNDDEAGRSLNRRVEVQCGG